MPRPRPFAARVLPALTAVIVTIAAACSSGASKTTATTVRPRATTTTTSGVPSVGCRTSGTVSPGTTRHTINVGGASHSYLVEVPRSYAGGRTTPMVLLFHGFSGNAASFATLTRMPARALSRGFVVVVPDGPGGTWQQNGRGTDATLVDAIVATVERDVCIDRARVAVAGFSAGAAFAIFYACAREGEFAAIATVAVDFLLGCRRPIAYLAFHGTVDPLVPYQNGAIGASLPGVKVRGTQLNLGDWARLDRCASTPANETVGTEVRHATWTGCTGGTSVQLYTVVGGGHSWPGANPKLSPLQHTTEDIDATTLMLDFFAAHRAG